MRELRHTKRCTANHSTYVRCGTFHNHGGFSLIELLITVAIILILVTLYWGGMSNDPERQRHMCAHNLSKIHLSMEIYARDNAGKYPAAAGAPTAEAALDVLV